MGAFQGTYDPKKVSVTFGPVLITGVADGTFIESARNNQAVNLTVGSQGDGARAISNDKSGTVTVTLLSTSPSNALLEALAKTDELSGTSVLPLGVKDLSAPNNLVVGGESWIQQVASVGAGRELDDGNREWVFETLNHEFGSNPA